MFQLHPGTLVYDVHMEEWGIVIGPVDTEEKYQWGHRLDAVERFGLKHNPGWWVRWYDASLDETSYSYVTRDSFDMGDVVRADEVE